MRVVLAGFLLSVGVAALYLSIAATVCVARDRSLTPGIKLMRILSAWCIPVFGAVVTLWVAFDTSQSTLRRHWWLWPLRALIGDAGPSAGFQEVVDMRADAERILPGHTWTPPP